MNIPVPVELKNFKGKVTVVLDDELHALIHEGLVSYKQALKALKDAGLALDKRFYPWLLDIENRVNGEFEPPAEPVEAKPELVSKKAVKAIEAAPDEDHNDNPKGAK